LESLHELGLNFHIVFEFITYLSFLKYSFFSSSNNLYTSSANFCIISFSLYPCCSFVLIIFFELYSITFNFLLYGLRLFFACFNLSSLSCCISLSTFAICSSIFVISSLKCFFFSLIPALSFSFVEVNCVSNFK